MDTRHHHEPGCSRGSRRVDAEHQLRTAAAEPENRDGRRCTRLLQAGAAGHSLLQGPNAPLAGGARWTAGRPHQVADVLPRATSGGGVARPGGERPQELRAVVVLSPRLAELAAGQVAARRGVRDGLRQAAGSVGLEQRDVPGCLRFPPGLVRCLRALCRSAGGSVPERGVRGYSAAAVRGRTSNPPTVRVLGMGMPRSVTR